MAAHQAPPSLGFSRQEHWSGLPFPSPMHESEKWKWSCSVVSDCSQPYGLQPTRLPHPWDFPGKSTGEGCHCLLWYFLYREVISSQLDIMKLTHRSPVSNNQYCSQYFLPYWQLYPVVAKLSKSIPPELWESIKRLTTIEELPNDSAIPSTPK